MPERLRAPGRANGLRPGGAPRNGQSPAAALSAPVARPAVLGPACVRADRNSDGRGRGSPAHRARSGGCGSGKSGTQRRNSRSSFSGQASAKSARDRPAPGVGCQPELQNGPARPGNLRRSELPRQGRPAGATAPQHQDPLATLQTGGEPCRPVVTSRTNGHFSREARHGSWSRAQTARPRTAAFSGD